MAGGHKGKWSWITQNFPDYFGRHRRTIPPVVRNVYLSINAGTIDESIPQLLEEGVAVKKGKGYEIDLTKTSFSKVLGKGQIKHALNIKADAFSASAIEKIENAGGKAITVSEEAE